MDCVVVELDVVLDDLHGLLDNNLDVKLVRSSIQENGGRRELHDEAG